MCMEAPDEEAEAENEEEDDVIENGQFNFRISSNKHRIYVILILIGVALIRGRRLMQNLKICFLASSVLWLYIYWLNLHQWFIIKSNPHFTQKPSENHLLILVWTLAFFPSQKMKTSKRTKNLKRTSKNKESKSMIVKSTLVKLPELPKNSQLVQAPRAEPKNWLQLKIKSTNKFKMVIWRVLHVSFWYFVFLPHLIIFIPISSKNNQKLRLQ